VLFENWVLPLVRVLDLTAFSTEAFDGTELFLLGCLQIVALYVLIRPLERWRPAEIQENPQDRRLDLIYTAFHRLGGFALLAFFIITPLVDELESWLRLSGFERLQLDDVLGINHIPLLTFIVYFVVLDFVGYWLHRGQHRLNLWWQLHALHHANRSMSLWSDNRNHVLDDLILDGVVALIALLIGTEPEQFVGFTIVTKMQQSWQHANVRLNLGRLGFIASYIVVSPTFHRTHHAIGSGYEGKAHGCNFGVVLPWWDWLFRTAKPYAVFEPTGVRDQLTGRNYGTTFWSQQWFGILRLIGKA
jgi:sterol desaturase/sphingolipid hydroxylase (fatty acid hydroxylase superfamily)